MAAQYSNRHFLEKHRIFIWPNFLKLEADILQDALDKLPLEQIINIETELRNINALACEGDIIALVDEANAHNDDAFVKEIAIIEGFHANKR